MLVFQSRVIFRESCVLLVDVIVVRGLLSDRQNSCVLWRWEICLCGGRAALDDLRGQDQFSGMERLKAAMGLLGIWEWTHDLSPLCDWLW